MSASELDARGLRCPIPVIRLAAASKGQPAGSIMSALTTDPAAVHDIPAWARMRGHRLVSIENLEGYDRITVELT